MSSSTTMEWSRLSGYSQGPVNAQGAGSIQLAQRLGKESQKEQLKNLRRGSNASRSASAASVQPVGWMTLRRGFNSGSASVQPGGRKKRTWSLPNGNRGPLTAKERRRSNSRGSLKKVMDGSQEYDVENPKENGEGFIEVRYSQDQSSKGGSEECPTWVWIAAGIVGLLIVVGIGYYCYTLYSRDDSAMGQVRAVQRDIREVVGNVVNHPKAKTAAGVTVGVSVVVGGLAWYFQKVPTFLELYWCHIAGAVSICMLFGYCIYDKRCRAKLTAPGP